MDDLAIIPTASLPSLVDRASQALAGARSAAEVLEARDMAGFAYDAAKRAGRLVQAKGAHDDVVAAIRRTQADALEIETRCKCRLADEFDAAQPQGAERGGRPKTVPDGNGFTAAEAGLTRKLVHEARQVRDAEKADPGVVRRALDIQLAKGKEPNRAFCHAAPYRETPECGSSGT